MSFLRHLLILMTTAFIAQTTAGAADTVDLVHPLNWWSGMHDTNLQIVLHGDGIGACQVQLEGAQCVRIERIERVENQNYLFLYLDLNGAPEQTFNICLTRPGETSPNIRQPYELRERSNRRPDAFGPQDVLYLLMPDRFVNGNAALDHVPGMQEPDVKRYNKKSNPQDFGRHGGDLAGISSQLDYLTQLGVTAIWPTPVQTNDGPVSYHGYAITNYYEIDPRLGSNEEYRALVEDCHRHGLKMVMDLVFNHCGANNLLYRDLPQRDWFNFDSQFVRSNYRVNSPGDMHASQYDLKYTTDGWFDTNMPDWNQRNPLVKDYLIQTSLWWIEYAGIDGIRQDTYPYADREMMAEWNLRLQREYPGFNVVGETWVNTAAGVACWQKDSKLSDFNSQLPTVMDFPLMGLLNSALDEETNDWNEGLSRIYDYISGDRLWANPNYLLTFLDNHDTDRFAPNAEKAKQISRYRQALTLLLTLRGIPQLYYGDELGEWGNRREGDGRLRQDMPLPATTKRGYSRLQKEYLTFATTLLQWRKGSKAVHEGQLMHFGVSQGCYVYSRYTSDDRVVIILNGTSQPVDLALERYAEVLPGWTDGNAEAREVITNRTIQLGQNLSLKPREVLVLQF